MKRLHRVPLIAIVAASCAGLVLGAGPAVAAASAQPASAAGGVSASVALPGVAAAPGGWIDYTSLLASKLTLVHATTTTLTGTRKADGTCDVRGGGTTFKPGTGAHYQEEVAYNPGTCQERILSGALTAGDLAKLPTSGTSAARPAAVTPDDGSSFESAYVKTAWIDPVNINVTSLAANLIWPLDGVGEPSGSLVPHNFAYSGWSSTGPSSDGVTSGDEGYSLEGTDTFTNTAFASFVYFVFGVSGWIACGSPSTATAVFTHDVDVDGFLNADRGGFWNDNISGACTTLVHHGEWDGYGTTS